MNYILISPFFFTTPPPKKNGMLYTQGISCFFTWRFFHISSRRTFFFLSGCIIFHCMNELQYLICLLLMFIWFFWAICCNKPYCKWLPFTYIIFFVFKYIWGICVYNFNKYCSPFISVLKQQRFILLMLLIILYVEKFYFVIFCAIQGKWSASF